MIYVDRKCHSTKYWFWFRTGVPAHGWSLRFPKVSGVDLGSTSPELINQQEFSRTAAEVPPHGDMPCSSCPQHGRPLSRIPARCQRHPAMMGTGCTWHTISWMQYSCNIFLCVDLLIHVCSCLIKWPLMRESLSQVWRLYSVLASNEHQGGSVAHP